MIGLKRGTVRLTPYNKRWSDYFEKERRALSNALGRTVRDIQHVGSTSIPGIMAKPIIDIDLGVESVRSARPKLGKLKSLGYTFRPSATARGDRWKLTYVKGPEWRRTVHLHVLRYHGALWYKNAFFRDRLRSNTLLARRYEKLKRDLATKYPLDRKLYTSSKEEFIRGVLSQRSRRS